VEEQVRSDLCSSTSNQPLACFSQQYQHAILDAHWFRCPWTVFVKKGFCVKTGFQHHKTGISAKMHILKPSTLCVPWKGKTSTVYKQLLHQLCMLPQCSLTVSCKKTWAHLSKSFPWIPWDTYIDITVSTEIHHLCEQMYITAMTKQQAISKHCLSVIHRVQAFSLQFSL